MVEWGGYPHEILDWSCLLSRPVSHPDRPIGKTHSVGWDAVDCAKQSSLCWTGIVRDRDLMSIVGMP